MSILSELRTMDYIPNFISPEEEQQLLTKIYQAPKPKWTTLLNRRLQNWGGLPHEKGMVQEPLPDWLEEIVSRVSAFNKFQWNNKTVSANHVLINEYLPGQGIMPHLDGSLYAPTIGTLSLGSHVLLDYYQPLSKTCACTSSPAQIRPTCQCRRSLAQRYVGSVLLEARSLVFFTDDLYEKYLHGIEERTEDVITEQVLNRPALADPRFALGSTVVRQKRVSLTIRHVPKVFKNKILVKIR